MIVGVSFIESIHSLIPPMQPCHACIASVPFVCVSHSHRNHNEKNNENHNENNNENHNENNHNENHNEKNNENVAFFRAPGVVSTFTCTGDRIAVGCEDGEVLHLQAPWLVEEA